MADTKRTSVEGIVGYFDRNGDKEISFRELENFARESLDRRTIAEFESIYNFIDADDKRFIHKEDLIDFVKFYGNSEQNIQPRINQWGQPKDDIPKKNPLLKAVFSLVEDEARRNRELNGDVKNVFLKFSRNREDMTKREFEDMVEGLKLPRDVTRRDIEDMYHEIGPRDKRNLEMKDFLDAFRKVSRVEGPVENRRYNEDDRYNNNSQIPGPKIRNESTSNLHKSDLRPLHSTSNL